MVTCVVSFIGASFVSGYKRLSDARSFTFASAPAITSSSISKKVQRRQYAAGWDKLEPHWNHESTPRRRQEQENPAVAGLYEG
jgi:hypothetical protein